MNPSKKAILITGANGFVGRRLCKTLLQQGHKISAFVRSEEDARRLQEENRSFSNAFHFQIADDLITAASSPTFFDDIEVVIHLAARAHVVRESIENPLAEFRSINVDITRHLAEKAAERGIKRFIYLSSVKVHGENSSTKDGEIKKITENDPLHPEDAYGQSKWEAEQVLWEIADKSPLEIVILRSTLIYGKEATANFQALVKLVKMKIPLPLASIQNLRSMIYVENLCNIISCCLNHKNAANQSFLVSDSEPISTPKLIRNLSKALGVPLRLYKFPVSWLYFLGLVTGKRKAISRLTSSLVIDNFKCRNLLEWQPPFSMKEALTRDFSDPNTFSKLPD